MNLFGQAWNKIKYLIHQTAYDPEAEEFAKKQALIEETEKQRQDAERDKKKREESENKLKSDEEKKRSAEDAARLNKQIDEAERNKFDFWRLIQRVLNTTVGMITTFVTFAAAVWGASLATNINVYRDWPYRLLYAVYGFVFFFIVIPYVMLYRWFWKGLKPRYYALIPLMPYHFDHQITAFLFSWLSFRPDDQMNALKEWEKEYKQ
jgi:cation transport ATPase